MSSMKVMRVSPGAKENTLHRHLIGSLIGEADFWRARFRLGFDTGTLAVISSLTG